MSKVRPYPREPFRNKGILVSIPYTHSPILPFPFHQALSRSKYSETLLVLYGQYSSIYILDSTSLETVCMLRSGCKPNWNAHITFLLNPEKKGLI